jgi:Spy/CpxP family protein refolding chaperone
MNNRAKWLIVGLAMTGIAGGVYAQTTAQTTGGTNTTPAAGAPAGGHRHWHHRGGMAGGFMMHALHQLALTDAQKQSVHGILANARAQSKAQHQGGGAMNFAALNNPGDPNHAAALQDLQARLSARIQARDAVRQQIYGVLTQDQKTQLASIIAARQAKWAQHNAS